MRPFGAVALLTLALAAPAAAKGGHGGQVNWISHTKSGNGFEVRFEILVGDVRVQARGMKPVVTLEGARYPAKALADDTWSAHVPMPAPGSHVIAVEGFDPFDRHRFAERDEPLVIADAGQEPAPSGGFNWLLPSAIALLLIASMAVGARFRPRRQSPAGTAISG